MKIRSVKFNFIMNFILTASSFIFPLITAPYIYRVLQPEATGRVDFVASIITYFITFASLGIPTYGIRACARVRDDKEKLSKVVQELMIINTTTMGIAYVVFLLLLSIVPEFRAERDLMMINSISMVLNVIGVNWFYNGIEQYAYITTVSIVCKAISIVFMFLMVKSPTDYVIYGAITVFAGSASYILNFVNLRKFISFRKTGKYEFKKHVRPILVFFSMSAAISIYTNLDTVMIRFIKGNTEVGYYSAAIKVKNLLVSLITSLGAVLLPRLSYVVEKGDKEIFKSIIEKAFNFVLLIGLSVSVYFTLFARESILLLSGSSYTNSILPMMLLMPAVLFIGLSNITGIQVLTPNGMERKVLYSILAGAALNICLNLVLIPRHGASGAALATTLAELVVLIVQIVFLRDMMREMVKRISIGKNLLAAIVATGITLIIMSLIDTPIFITLVISAILFFGVYVVVLIITKEKFVNETILGFIKNKRLK
ncbi:MAG: flippase [Suipraeoptans sp.]